MTMRILFFAQTRDAAGCAEIRWENAGPMDGAAIWDRLVVEFPALAGHRHCTRLARNGTYAGDTELFQPGDEIALIPPVSGG